MLTVKLLAAGAKAPAVAHQGDLGYDLFAYQSITLEPGDCGRKASTGIAVQATHPSTGQPLGLLIRDRSSMAARGVFVTGGVIDAGYRGEIIVVFNNLSSIPITINAGDKIAQMIPVEVLTSMVDVVDQLDDSSRADKGFGSSGR